MSTSNHRDIRWRDKSRALADLLQSIVATELLVPSRHIWLISPWISDISVLDNTVGQFASIVPEWERAPVRLSTVLHHLVAGGTNLTVALNDTDHNRGFWQEMTEVRRLWPDRINLYRAPRLHEKGLLGDRYYLSGSFNFTYNGISLNEEVAHFYTDSAVVAENRIALQGRWSGAQT